MREKGVGITAKNCPECNPALLIYINYTENLMDYNEKTRKLTAKYTNRD